MGTAPNQDRTDQRPPSTVSWRSDAATLAELLRAHPEWLRRNGVFLPVASTARAGEELDFALLSKTDARLLSGRGKVLWTADGTRDPFERAALRGVALEIIRLEPREALNDAGPGAPLREQVRKGLESTEATRPGWLTDVALFLPPASAAAAAAERLPDTDRSLAAAPDAEQLEAEAFADVEQSELSSASRVLDSAPRANAEAGQAREARREPQKRTAKRHAPMRELEPRAAGERERLEAEERAATDRDALLGEAEERAAAERDTQLRAAEERAAVERDAQRLEAEKLAAAEREAQLREAEKRAVAERDALLREAEKRAASERDAQAREAARRAAAERDAEARLTAELERRSQAEARIDSLREERANAEELHRKELLASARREELLRAELQRAQRAAGEQLEQLRAETAKARAEADAASRTRAPAANAEPSADALRLEQLRLDASRAALTAELAKLEAATRLELARAEAARAEGARLELEAKAQARRVADAHDSKPAPRAPDAPPPSSDQARLWYALGALAATGVEVPAPPTTGRAAPAEDPALQLALAALKKSAPARSPSKGWLAQVPAGAAAVLAAVALLRTSMPTPPQTVIVREPAPVEKFVQVAPVSPPGIATADKEIVKVAPAPLKVETESNARTEVASSDTPERKLDPPPDARVARGRTASTSDRQSGNAAALVKQGDAALRAGKIDDALAAFTGALKADSRFAPAHRGMGAVLTMQGKDADAAAAYRRYLTLAPNATDRGRIEALLEQ